ncbi:hypothetical protein [Chondrinema litorale]|uniref:hypothetical protein n=1 Tax=Chondrinema litorale TaxID=2994555 RepID=UPI002543BF96|nr:hypothetical protein [Chondrinema litorale]UZR99677.1 hypothetical protein OQ292_37945 [Chondrinema litorale]
MKIIFSPIIFIFLFQLCKAQIPIGYYYDNNGTPMEGYFDPLTYAPERAATMSHISKDFKEGHFYDLNGTKHYGYIKFAFNKILFKTDGSADPYSYDKIKAKELTSFVVGTDSFISFHVSGNKDLLQIISDTKEFKIAKRYDVTNKMQWQFNTTYLYTAKGGSKPWFVISSINYEFRTRALKMFGHIPYVKQKIENKTYKYNDIETIIKTVEYYEKYQNNLPIQFDANWEETVSKEQTVYTGKIVKIDSIGWHINYYKKDVKVYSGIYTGFSPNNLEGDFISYYENGNPRKKTFFRDKLPKRVTTYFPDGSIHHDYSISIIDKEIRYSYLTVNTPEGKNLIKPAQKFEEQFNDSITGNTYINEFEASNLTNSYRIEDGEKIYRKFDKNINLSTQINKLLKDHELEISNIEADVNGVMLLALVIDKEGYANKSMILNQVDTETYRIVKNAIDSNLKQTAAYRTKFETFKLNGQKVMYEVVIPIVIDISKFYKKPSNNINNYYWMNNLLFQQHMNTPLNITAPPSLR